MQKTIVVTEGGEVRRGSWETGIDMYALLYIKQMTNKDLSYSTGKSTQNSAMTHMGKEPKKKKEPKKE